MKRRTVETVATVTPDGTLTAHVPAEVPPGAHLVVVMVEEAPGGATRSGSDGTPSEVTTVQSTGSEPGQKRGPFGIHIYDVGPWPRDLSLRREDMYGDWGR